MARPLMLRMAGALGAAVLAVLFVALVPFVGAGLDAGADPAKAPAVTVNREFKGDRLPLPVGLSIARGPFGLQQTRPGEIPLGCDAAFSPISAPALASLYGRCMA